MEELAFEVSGGMNLNHCRWALGFGGGKMRAFHFLLSFVVSLVGVKV